MEHSNTYQILTLQTKVVFGLLDNQNQDFSWYSKSILSEGIQKLHMGTPLLDHRRWRRLAERAQEQAQILAIV